MIKFNKLLFFKNVSLFLCLVPMLLLSLFCLVPNKDKLNVSAYSSVNSFSFHSSNLITTVTPMNNNTIQAWHFIDFSVNISFDGNNRYDVNISGTTMGRGNSNTFGNPHPFGDTLTYNVYQTPDNYISPFNPTMSDASSYSLPFVVNLNGWFNGQVTRVVLDNSVGVDYTGSTADIIYNKVTYYDTEDNFVSVYVASYYSGSTYNVLTSIDLFKFDYRSYYIGLVYSNNNYYEAGYTDGYSAGVVDGSNTGYTDGYNAGVDVGYSDGYNAGVEHSNEYSFSSLMGSVVDAPVSAFTSLLNFELFGVNLLGVVTGLLSVGVIVLIVKLCLGG